MKAYLKHDIARILGRNYKTIQSWVDKGIIVPEIRRSSGRGNVRIYGEQNLLHFAMTDILLKRKISIRDTKFIINALKKRKPVWEGQYALWFRKVISVCVLTGDDVTSWEIIDESDDITFYSDFVMELKLYLNNILDDAQGIIKKYG